MDVEHFLKERTRFIRYFYDNGVVAFHETMRQINEEEEPFIPPYSEDGEPAFVANIWMRATGSERWGSPRFPCCRTR